MQIKINRNTSLKRADLALAKQFRFKQYDESAIGECEQINENGVRTYMTPFKNIYPSITTVMSWHSSKGIADWRARVGEKEANKISKQATKKGTALHNLCENYILNNLELGEANFEVIDMFKIIKKILDKHLDNIYCVEKRLYSDFIGVAGTTDCIAEFDGIPSIIDFKTSRRMKKRENISHYFMQTSGYAVMFEELTRIPIPQVVIIMVSEGEVEVFKAKRNDYVYDMIELVKQYKLVNGIDNGINKDSE